MKKLLPLVVALALCLAGGVGELLAADAMTFFYTANTYGAFAPCPT